MHADIENKHLVTRGQLRNVENSSVLVIVYFNQANTPMILFTKRSSKLRNHAGEISFPGGRMSIHDSSLVDTAIRETYEEIGLLIDKENIVGSLDPINTYTTRILIYPFVVILTKPATDLIPNEEVDEIIELPLEKLMESVEVDDLHSNGNQDMFKFSVDGYLIWGATARIVKNLIEIVENARH
jgi:8-oxo-dGTP pyrophosphatase MutT (NUDIX family)